MSFYLMARNTDFQSEKNKQNKTEQNKNLKLYFSFLLHSKVKDELYFFCLLLKKLGTKIFHFNYYRKINCDLFFQIPIEPQISIIIKVVTRWMSEKLKNGKEFTPELPNS